MINPESFILAASILILLSVLVSKATGKLGVPALLFFLVIGMLAGVEGIGKIVFDDPRLTQMIGTLSLIFILFSGGLETEWKEIRPILRPAVILSSVGVVITSLCLGLFASYLLDITFWEGILIGGIMGSTDAAAVFMVLRSQKIGLKGNIRPLLELESGSNDPIAVFLTVGVISLLNNELQNSWELIPLFLRQMILGAPMGIFAGKFFRIVINSVKLEYESLYPALTIALVLILYGVTQSMGGNGFLAVYLAGIFLKRENFLHKKSLTLFHDGVAWLMQISMFLMLGLLVTPSKLIPVMVPGMLIALFLVFVARPVAVFLSLIGHDYQIKEKLMISWVGLRGAVPIILATFPLVAKVHHAEIIFNIVFFIVLTSTLIQGTSIQWMAKILKVNTPFRKKFRFPIENYSNRDMFNDLFEVDIPAGTFAVGKSIVELDFPKASTVLLIRRKGDVFVPRGSTQIEEKDAMLILSSEKDIEEILKLVAPDPLTAISIKESGINEAEGEAEERDNKNSEEKSDEKKLA